MEKPTIPKGTRDFGPAQMAKRQFILDRIRNVFQKFGFLPLETPSMENLSTLTGKYGEEGDQLLFKVLNSGDFLKEPIKLIEVDPAESNKINDLLRTFSRDLLSNLTIKHLEFLYKNTQEIGNEIGLLARGFDFSSSAYGQGLKQFLIDHSTDLAREINIETTARPNDPKELLLQFILRTNSVAARLKSEFESKKLAQLISEKGLRYDLTVPFARYVVMNRHEITFPFKRYQIQPVWRADRPQKGRYREFYQCDADVVGTDSLLCEAEIILMINESFAGLGIQQYTIKINHRGILSGLAELAGVNQESSLFVAIDKLDKIGEDKVREELKIKGVDPGSINLLFDVLNFKGTPQSTFEFLSTRLAGSKNGTRGISQLREVLRLLEAFDAGENHVAFDVSLARGLSYYTGTIFEVKIHDVAIGSVSGGGRYDNLTGVFGMPGVSGTGISFGVDRLYDAMEELQLFPKETSISSRVLVTYLDDSGLQLGLKVVQTLRKNGISSEIYPDASKLKKQLDYANKKMIPYVIVIGSEEIAAGLLTFKNMTTGEQQKMTLDQIVRYDF